MTRRRALTLARAVDRFVAHLALAGRRPRGIDSYRKVLDTMLDALGNDTDPRTLERSDMLDVVAHWGNVSSTTRATRISVLRSFGAWLADELDVDDPCAKLPRPKKRRPVRRRPDQDVVARLLAEAEGRDLLVVALLAMTGFRVSDLLALRWGSVEEHRCLLYVEDGKGGKGRPVPIPAQLAFLLREHRSRRAAEASHYVVCRWQEWETPTRGHHLRYDATQPAGQATPYKILERLSRAAGVPNVNPHQLRRAYADTYYRAHPNDVVGLQALLGHERLETTREYLEGPQLEEIADRVAGMDFVTLPAADNAVPVPFPPQSGGRPWNPAEVEAAGIEPASPLSPDAEPSSDEPSSPLDAPADSGIVTRPDERRGDA